MKFFNMVGKHCARCTGGIYTVWRTSANKNFYHPHCFTCAICHVVLENARECGMPNLKEIYCRECFAEYFSDNGRRVHRTCSISEEIENEILKQHAYNNNSTKQRVEVQDSRSACTGGRSRQQQSRRHHNRTSTSSGLNEVNEGDVSEEINGGLELIGISSASARKILTKPMHNMDCGVRHANMNHNLIMDSGKVSKTYDVERKVSRIPRPTSASSKKCLTSKSNSKITNTSVNTLKTTRPAEVCPRPPLAKMGRSVSLVQPRKIQQPNENHNSNLVSIGTETSSTSFCPSTPRPRSASSSTYPAKRQCAASFSTSSNNIKIIKRQINYNTPFKAPLTHTERFQNMKSGIPSTQDILSVISRESSDLDAIKTLNQMHTPRYRAGCASSIPRRTYNITFDCPICIGSLVQSGSIDLREGSSKGNVVTHCGHLFHRECMENWLRIKGNSRCPICSTLCVPETLQSVYLECNVSVDENSKTKLARENCKFDKNSTSNEAFEVLKSEYDILKTRYDDMLAENEEFSFKAAIASSLQSAYDMECRNRLQLQWENKKLMRQMEELQNNRY